MYTRSTQTNRHKWFCICCNGKNEPSKNNKTKCLSLLPYRNIQVPKTILLVLSNTTRKKKPENVLHPKHQEFIINIKTNTNRTEWNRAEQNYMHNTQYRYYRHVPKGSLYATLVSSSRSFVHVSACSWPVDVHVPKQMFMFRFKFVAHLKLLMQST